MSIRKTKTQFILDAEKTHKNKYIYDKVIYINAHTKVIITCKIHGDFIITPDCLLNNKQICQKCKKKELLLINKNNFLKKAKNKFGDTFCYSLMHFKSMVQKIKIICPIHGVFETKPQEHLRSKYGCYQCNKKSQKKLFNINILNNRKKIYKKHIEKAKNKFGKKFDYTTIDFTKRIREKNNIICSIHGIQKINILKHLESPTGCSFCSKENISFKRNNNIKIAYKYSLSELINLSNKKYNNKFDYSLVKQTPYITDKIKIICPNPRHGVFEQTFSQHLAKRTKHGCPKCGDYYTQKAKKKYNQKTFIKKCVEVWGNEIDYSLTNFIDTENKTFFTCKKHSYTYKQQPKYFLKKRIGCKYCHKKSYNGGGLFVKNKKAYIYLFKINNLYDFDKNQLNMIFNKKAIKFGMTHDLKERKRRLKRKLNGSIKLIALYSAKDNIISKAESEIKKLMSKEMYYIDREIMKDGFSETVEYTKKNIERIINYCDNNKDLTKENLKQLV
jgi:hypothetical protein